MIHTKHQPRMPGVCCVSLKHSPLLALFAELRQKCPLWDGAESRQDLRPGQQAGLRKDVMGKVSGH